jgi:hypothetical protein
VNPDGIRRWLSGKSRRTKIIMVVIIAWILLAVAESVSGISIDVGGNDDLFFVSVQNDTSHTVVLGECSGDCGSFDYTWVLKPHQSASTGQDPDGVFRPMEVLSRSKAVLGCMPFQFSKTPPSGTVVQISQMVPCGRSLGAAVSGYHDWPFYQY